MERYALQRRVDGAPVILVDPGTVEHRAICNLITYKRLSAFQRPDRWHTAPTDLGRLALRVCPVNE